jgi:hypothetical protein
MPHASISRHIPQSQRGALIAAIVSAAAFAAAPPQLAAQGATRAAADTPSQNAETRVQSDSITVHLLRSPKGKPAELSAGGKTAAQARKFSGKPASTPGAAPVETPLPTRARTTKP